jgi:hypothetical protein
VKPRILVTGASTRGASTRRVLRLSARLPGRGSRRGRPLSRETCSADAPDRRRDRGRAAGLNLPAIRASLLLGVPLEDDGYRAGVRFRAEAGDARGLLAELGRGNLAAARDLVPRRNTVHALFSTRDRLSSWQERRRCGCGDGSTRAPDREREPDLAEHERFVADDTEHITTQMRPLGQPQPGRASPCSSGAAGRAGWGARQDVSNRRAR